MKKTECLAVVVMALIAIVFLLEWCGVFYGVFITYHPNLNPNSRSKVEYVPIFEDDWKAVLKGGTIENVKYFTERIRVDVNAKFHGGRTPLHFAAEHNSNIEVLKHLIESGADVNAKDNQGRIPLDIANTEEKRNILREAMEATKSVTEPAGK